MILGNDAEVVDVLCRTLLEEVDEVFLYSLLISAQSVG